MKILFYFFLMLLSVSIASSQDNEPTLQYFTIKGKQEHLQKDNPIFKQNKFLLGLALGRLI